MPVTIPANDQLEGVGYHSNVDGLGVTLDALHVNLGSGENFRHLEHGSETSRGPRVWSMLDPNNTVAQTVNLLEQAQDVIPNMQTSDRKKFNSIVNDYMESTTKESLEALADAVAVAAKLMVG